MDGGLKDIIGSPIGKYGAERTMFEHKSNANRLVGVEHQVRSPLELMIYQNTTNIFHAVFPRNFVKVVRAETDPVENKSYAVIGKVNASHEGFGPKYQEGRRVLLEQVGSIIKEEALPNLAEYFDFKGDRPNILLDQGGNPVYTDKINPFILDIIDKDRLVNVVKDPRKQEVLLRMIKETIDLRKSWKARQDEIEAMLG